MTGTLNRLGSDVRRTGWNLLALIALASVAPTGAALAQDQGVAGDLVRTATASPQEKLVYAGDAVDELRASVKTAEKLADDARRSGDTEQVDCISERLSQLRALAQVTEVAQTTMTAALQAGEQERADHELRKIAVALSKSRKLSLEAQACTDDSGLASGETTVRVEGGLTGDGDETDPLDVDVLDQGFDPPQQSPFN